MKSEFTSLLAWAGAGMLLLCSLPGWANTELARGQKIFQNCASCHQLGPQARHGFGPALNQIFGQKAGSRPGYAYSAAMRNSKLIWDDTSLRAFLKDPAAVVPGTKMRFWGYSDEQKLSDLIAYLKSQQIKP